MRADMEIVTGFIGSGKTKFMNTWLKKTLVPEERVLIVQYELGETELTHEYENHPQVRIIRVNPVEPLNITSFEDILKMYVPHRVIIEYNGTRKLEELLELLDEKQISPYIGVATFFYLADAVTFDMFMGNMGGILEQSIYYSDLIVINHMNRIGESAAERLERTIRTINSRAYLIKLGNLEDLEEALNQQDIIDNGVIKRFRIRFRNFLHSMKG